MLLRLVMKKDTSENYPGVVMDTVKAPHTYVDRNSHPGRQVATIISNTDMDTTTTTITISTFQCLSDPSGCAAPGNTNMFGYPAHFDLQNANLQVDHMDADTE